jgi:hypothetical protein
MPGMRRRQREGSRGIGAQLLRMAILMGIILLAYFAFIFLGGAQWIAEFLVQFAKANWSISPRPASRGSRTTSRFTARRGR